MGKRNMKSIAESQFNFNAKPISIRKFLTDLQEEEGTPVFSLNSEISVVSPIKREEPVIPQISEEIAKDISLTKHLSPIEDVDDFEISTLFEEPELLDPVISSVVIVDNELGKINSEDDFQFKISNELNYNRRLIKLASYMQKKVPKFSSEVMKVKRDLSSIQPESIHINDSRGILELESLYKESILNHNPKFFFINTEKELSLLKENQPFTSYHCHLLIKEVFRVSSGQPLPLTRNINDYLNFKENVIKLDLTIEELFSKADIFFIDSLIGESSYNRVIIPIVTVLYSQLSNHEKFQKFKYINAKASGQHSLHSRNFLLYVDKYGDEEFLFFDRKEF